MGGENSKSVDLPKIGAMGRLREDMKIYKLVDLHGAGELVPWMRYADRSGDHSIIDSYIDVKISEFLYNQGKGKLLTVTELVKLRNKERNAMLSAFSRKKGKGKSGPNVLDEFNQEGENVGDLKKALKLLDGGGKGGKGESKYREMCWKIDERGSMGETVIGVCLMANSTLHNKLVLKILDTYPKLINDISISEDYYGLSPLHQAIVNQDVPMVATLLRRGADVQQRCYGAFFCAEDQKTSRTDSLEHEYVELSPRTTYTGHMYFGEYPLSFAACMDHPDCFRLLIAFKEMFRLAVEKGASLRIANKQRLTPLTLAAKLAKKQMFLEILSMEAMTVWEYGSAKQTAYPLARIDTINETTGDMNDESALSLVVYGDTPEHLDLLDGILESLCEAKWETFAKRNWMKSFAAFCFYYVFFFAAFMTRPYTLTTNEITFGYVMENGTTRQDYMRDPLNPDKSDFLKNGYSYVSQDGTSRFDPIASRCHLRNYMELPWTTGYLRLVCEVAVFLMLIVQVTMDIRDIRHMGRHKWLNIYRAFPAKLMYKASFVLVVLIIPCRLACSVSDLLLILDNTFSVLALLFTTVHFLFYFRAFKFVGPFVLMLYTIISTDIVRFLFIYGMFLIGFSQAFYIVFLGCERRDSLDIKAGGPKTFENLIQSPQEALLRTFIATVGEFINFYKALATCPVDLTRNIGKALFLMFELFVSILQINLLIAMMTHTYETIFYRRREWKRQWAQVILMVELSVSPQERIRHLLSYSRPTGTNKKERSYVVSKKFMDEQMEEFEKRAKAEREALAHEERKFVAKRKRVDMEFREGVRPTTAFVRRPQTGSTS